jgi:hypothetical protein
MAAADGGQLTSAMDYRLPAHRLAAVSFSPRVAESAIRSPRLGMLIPGMPIVLAVRRYR